MAPLNIAERGPYSISLLLPRWDGSWRHDESTEAFIVESWSQGFMIGALIIMAGVTAANMGKKILHKLILLELFLAMPHGTFCFFTFEGYGWYLSSTAVLLYLSYLCHNVVAWIKSKPFLSPRVSNFYIATIALTIPYWILEMRNNFSWFNNISELFTRTRPLEVLFRDPWWIFSCCNLVWVIKTRYNFGFVDLVRRCPRFGIMLASMLLSIIFIIVDVLTAIIPRFGVVAGINPYWKLALVFKCFCDTIILDDFRTALDKLRSSVFERASVPQPGVESARTTSQENNGLGTGPTRFSFAETPRSGSALTNEYPLDVDLDGRGRRLAQAKAAIGRFGTKLTHLPRLHSQECSIRLSSEPFLKPKPRVESRNLFE